MARGKAGAIAAFSFVVTIAAVCITSTSVAAAGLSTLLADQFVAVPASMLPAGVTYDDATCPNTLRCYAVGVVPAGAVFTYTADGGVTWKSVLLPATAGSTGFAISCPSFSTCYVGGGNEKTSSTLFKTTNAGLSWARESIPSGALVASIGCGSVEVCVAVGSNDSNPDEPSTVINTTDGGVTWQLQTPPASRLTTVRCLNPNLCWVAGPGAWRSTNDGVSWSNSSPSNVDDCPSGGFGICSFVWSTTIDIEFTSPSDGWVTGTQQCGKGGCNGIALHTTDGGVTWNASADSTHYSSDWQIACQASDCLLVSQSTSFSTIVSTTNDGASWNTMQQLPSVINALACNSTRTFCIAGGGLSNQPGLFTLGQASAAAPPPATKNNSPSVTSTFGSSLAIPASLVTAPLSVLINAILTVILILLITFPAQLFNRVYDENHTRIRDWWAARLPWVLRAQHEMPQMRPTLRTGLSVTAVLGIGALLAAILDPHFGFNLRSLALFTGALLALVGGATVSGLSAGAYRRTRHRVGSWHVRALPSALAITGLSVLISRLTDFQPGYLYGIIGGVVFSQQLSKTEQGHEVAIASVATLVVSISAWSLWVPVSAAAGLDPTSFGLALLENFLSALFITGMVGLLIELVPLRFLPGERLAQWHWAAWSLVFGVALLAIIEVIIRPQNHAARNNAPFWTTMALFVGFGVASVLFWLYFKVTERRVIEVSG
jgi:photosystem II stability/assembly factor-like uncharacterized protein